MENTTDNKFLGKIIERLRKQQDLSTAELAKKAGLSQASISHYENATRNPTFESIEKIAAALNVTVGDLRGQADLLANEKPHILDDAELSHEKRRAIERIYRYSDTVIRVNGDILISINMRVHDLANMVEYNTHHSSGIRARGPMSFEKDTTSIIAHLTEKVVNDFVDEHRDELLFRFEDELNRLNIDVYAMLEEIRKRNKN